MRSQLTTNRKAILVPTELQHQTFASRSIVWIIARMLSLGLQNEAGIVRAMSPDQLSGKQFSLLGPDGLICSALSYLNDVFLDFIICNRSHGKPLCCG
jgi:hypothetical protein